MAKHSGVLHRACLTCVPNVNMWVASVYNYNIPDCLIVEKVTVAIRSPPVVMQEVGRAVTIGRDVASYSISCVPAPTDGPAIKRLYHNKTPGHTEPDVIDDYIEECEQCGRDIARVLAELQVGNSGQGVNISGKQLHYRDVLVLCNYPSDDKVDSDGRVISPASGLVRGLRACHVPVRVVQDGLLEADVLDLVLSLRDEVIVAHWGRVQGLERKVVVVKDLGQMFYFHASSRCTSQLVVIDYKAPGEPEDIMENCDVSYDSDDKSDTMFGTNDDLIDDDESSDIDN